MKEMTVSKEKFLKVAKASQQIKSDVVSFSFVMASLFPDALKNIQTALSEEHLKGYLEGKGEVDNEDKGTN